jgi:hypothetical protein
MKINIERDSVCAGDDVDAPHAKSLELPSPGSLGQLVAAVRLVNYLPSIQGGQATWILRLGGQAVAVLAQQWVEPKYLVDSSIPVDSLIKPDLSEIFIEYCEQEDPQLVYDEYSKKAT